MNLITWLFGTWDTAREAVEDFRTGRTYQLQGDVSAGLALQDLRLRTGDKAAYHDFDSAEMLELNRMYQGFDALFAGRETLEDAYMIVDRLFFASKPIDADEYLSLRDAAHYYYRNELENSNRYQDWQEVGRYECIRSL